MGYKCDICEEFVSFMGEIDHTCGVKKKKKGLKYIRETIENEGFDYTFAHYSHFEEVDWPEFHKLRVKYLKSRNDLLELLGVEE